MTSPRVRAPVKVATLGFPRIGARRELKTALERFWSGRIDADGLSAQASELKAAAWRLQRDLGVDLIPSGDFSLYDHVLDATAMVGAVPGRFGWSGERVGIETYFAMARGGGGGGHEGGDGACAHRGGADLSNLNRHPGNREAIIRDHHEEAASLGRSRLSAPAFAGAPAGMTTQSGRLSRPSPATARAHPHPCPSPIEGEGFARSVAALEMTKWFDTNYHYLVPELTPDQAFRLGSTKPLDDFLEARLNGVETRPVLLGPVSWLLLGKAQGSGFDPLELLPRLLPVYAEMLRALARADAAWVQIDEPCLALDLDDRARRAFRQAYAMLCAVTPNTTRLMLTTGFGALGDNLETVLSLPVHGLHLDLVRGPDQLEPVLKGARPDLVLSLGVIDGRNVWKADLNAVLDRIAPAAAHERPLVLAPSCSLLHAPIDLERETDLDPEVRNWLAFAVQKIEELALLKRALNEGRDGVRGRLDASSAAVASRRTSAAINDPAVKARCGTPDPAPGQATPNLNRHPGNREAIIRDRQDEAASPGRSRLSAPSGAPAGMTTEWEALARRGSPVEARRRLQREALALPEFPTTTIGSFPQTAEVRKARADHAKGLIDDGAYQAFLRAETERAVRWQEEAGLDVLVHGEFERNDMVQYFAEQLDGFAFTRNGWVQSYGSRCVRPPILYGDVSRRGPMTVEGWRYAQGLTERPMKAMLTGPVTILNWSFVRDDQPRRDTCRQIALAVRDEVTDLAAAGARLIQIDEAALREGLPLRRAERDAYLDWAVEAFRIAASGVGDATQIHTHMCYSDFNDIISAIGAMDADVVSIECARSRMELLDAFRDYAYPGEIGPGVWDIHAPRVPTVDEMIALLTAAAGRLPPERLWVNPDCGLKTRAWAEVRPAVANMVAAARAMRTRAGK